MNPNVVLRTEAELDVTEAFLWYLERGDRVAAGFLAALDECVEQVRQFPESNAKVHKDVRRALLKRYPYGLFYVHEADIVLVIACFHASRDPQDWKDRATAHGEGI